jgi:hypothetical protein
MVTRSPHLYLLDLAITFHWYSGHLAKLADICCLLSRTITRMKYQCHGTALSLAIPFTYVTCSMVPPQVNIDFYETSSARIASCCIAFLHLHIRIIHQQTDASKFHPLRLPILRERLHVEFQH